jgi:hypothetical protein
MNFITFCNTGYGCDTARIIRQAEDFKLFDNIRLMSEKDIPEFINKHKHFIDKNPYGYGNYIWKPKIILDSLEQMKDGEILYRCWVSFKFKWYEEV